MTEHDGTTCGCACHDGPPGHYACSMVGGCGTTWQPPTVPAVVAARATVDLDVHTLDGEQACVLGCTNRNQHQPGCPCQATCPPHQDHCTGCAPRATFAGSLLCGSCFHRKLRAPLRRVPALWDWLESRKGGLKATAYDDMHVASSKDPPMPFNPAIEDHLTLTTRLMVAWCDRAVKLADPGPGPVTRDAVGAAAWLDKHAGWVAEQFWSLALITHLREIETRARRLAPWQAMRHALPMPCLTCQQQTLVLFGGEDWVTCVNPDCGEIIGWYRYASLSRALARIHERDVG